MVFSKIQKHHITSRKVIRFLAHEAKVFGHGIFSIPIKLWYGNNAGFRNNFGEKKRLKYLNRDFLIKFGKVDYKASILLAADSLSQNGYLTLPAYFDRTLLTNIKQHVIQKIEDHNFSICSPNGTTRFLLDPIANIPELAMLLRNEICEIITAYYQCAFRVDSVRVWRNYHVADIDNDKNDKFSNTFHHDNCPKNSLRVFVLLSDDVTRETGALRFHDKNASKKIMRQLGYFHREKLTKLMRKRLIDPISLRFFEGDCGEVCICNTQECIHAASIPKFGTYRDMLQFEIHPAPGPIQFSDELFKELPLDKGLLAMKR